MCAVLHYRPSLLLLCPQDLLALLTNSGFLSILRFDAALARWVLERGGRAVPMRCACVNCFWGMLLGQW